MSGFESARTRSSPLSGHNAVSSPEIGRLHDSRPVAGAMHTTRFVDRRRTTVHESDNAVSRSPGPSGCDETTLPAPPSMISSVRRVLASTSATRSDRADRAPARSSRHLRVAKARSKADALPHHGSRQSGCSRIEQPDSRGPMSSPRPRRRRKQGAGRAPIARTRRFWPRPRTTTPKIPNPPITWRVSMYTS